MNDLGPLGSGVEAWAGGSQDGASGRALRQHPHNTPASSTGRPRALEHSHGCTEQTSQSPAPPQDCGGCKTNYDGAPPRRSSESVSQELESS